METLKWDSLKHLSRLLVLRLVIQLIFTQSCLGGLDLDWISYSIVS